MSYVKGLKCRECGKTYPKAALYVCEFCFGSLEVDYDYEAIKKNISREKIEKGPLSIWRYRDLLPVDSEPTVGLNSGFTPLIKAVPCRVLPKRVKAGSEFVTPKQTKSIAQPMGDVDASHCPGRLRPRRHPGLSRREGILGNDAGLAASIH